MSDIPPPEMPGWYADAAGAWWYWDGGGWSPAPVPPSPAVTRDQERSTALLMWILYLVVGGWLGALVFYLVSKEKAFVRHHAAEALNLSIVLLVPQVVGSILIVPAYFDWISDLSNTSDATFQVTGLFLAGVALLVVSSLANYALGILGAIKAHRGAWSRLPIGLHPVRGVVRPGEEPYPVT